jgi:hypothetical protein
MKKIFAILALLSLALPPFTRIGHMKSEYRIGRNHLAGRAGDAANAVLATVGYNFLRLLAWLAVLLRIVCTLLTLSPGQFAVADCH